MLFLATLFVVSLVGQLNPVLAQDEEVCMYEDPWSRESCGNHYIFSYS